MTADAAARQAEVAAVRAFLDRHGLPGLVDVHTHFMPERVLAKVWAFFDSLGPGADAWPITYREDEQTRLELLRGFGVRRFTSLLYAHKPGMAAWLNTWAADFAARTPDCAHSATFFAEDCAEADVRHALDAGAQIFKCHVQVGGFDPADPVLDPVWGLLEDSGTPTVIHCGSGPRRGRHTGPDPVRAVLRRHPRLPLVIAHMGAPEYAEFLDLAGRYPGVRLDTTMAFTDFMDARMPFPPAERPRLADLADRIVLGSDFPNIPYEFVHQLQALERLDLGSQWLRAVCWDNPSQVLRLDGH